MTVDIVNASVTSFLDEGTKVLGRNVGALNKELSTMLESDTLEYRKGMKDEKNQVLTHVLEKLTTAGTIPHDYSEVISYLKSNQDDVEALKNIGRGTKKEQHRIDRKYYSIEAVVNKK